MNRRERLQTDKGHLQKIFFKYRHAATQNTECFPLNQEQGKGCLFLPLLFNSLLEILEIIAIQEKKIDKNIKKK